MWEIEIQRKWERDREEMGESVGDRDREELGDSVGERETQENEALIRAYFEFVISTVTCLVDAQ